MRKLLCTVSVLALCVSGSAQVLKTRTAFGKEQIRKTGTEKESVFKSTSLFKPATGKDFYTYDEGTDTFQDSSSIVFKYYPNGKLLSDEYSSLRTNAPQFREEFVYDQKDYTNKTQIYLYDGTTLNFYQESGNVSKYDDQNRIISLTQYSLDENKDTTGFPMYALISHYNDSIVVKYYSNDPQYDGAPNGVVEKDVYIKQAGAYASADFYFWINGQYILQELRKIEWNGPFSLENLLYGPEEVRVIAKYLEYAYTYEGVDYAGRIKATITPTKEIELIETKVGIVFTPEGRNTYTLDSKGNLILSEYEYTYNAVTQDYDEYQNYKTDITYQGDNKTSELYSGSNNTAPTYVKNELLTYADFKDLNGMVTIDPLQKISVFPNPAGSSISFVVNDKVSEVFAVDVCGRKSKLNYTVAEGKVTASVEVLENGVYTMIVRAEKGNFQSAITVVR